MRGWRRGAQLALLGLAAFAAYLPLLSAAPSAAAASVAGPSAAEMARCAAIGAADARLACYDALAKSSGAVSPGAAAAAARATASPAAASPASSGAAAPAANAPPSEATAIQNFGLSAAQQHLTDLGPRAIQARITSVARYEAGHASIVLDNDQSWVVNEDDGRLSAGDRVTIKRAAMGSFMLLSPANHTYHVRRVR